MTVIEPSGVETSPLEKKNDVPGDAPLPGYPFTIKDLRDSVPKHCFEISAWWGLYYYVKDIMLIALGYIVKPYFDQYIVTRAVWYVLQGFFFWLIFLTGHDCGHRTFSKSEFICDLFGHLSHSALLVPYHGWRISHHKHHLNHNHAEKEAAWRPVQSDMYEDWMTEMKTSFVSRVKFWMRYTPIVNLCLFPLYLTSDLPMLEGNHFNPWGRLFVAKERKSVALSAICVFAWLGGMIYLGTQFGTWWITDMYFIPWFISTMWLSLVTLLQHHQPGSRFFRDGTWSYLNGAMETIDHSYGVFDFFQHEIGRSHTAHHFFFNTIPHYHLYEALEHMKPILGKFRNYDDSFFLSAYWRTVKNCKYIMSEGKSVQYQKNLKKEQ